MEAVETLSGSRIEARVLSMHTLKPIDRQAIVAAGRETGGIVTVEEHGVSGGLGSRVADVLLEEGIPARLRKFGIDDRLRGLVGSQNYLRAQMGSL